MARTNFIETQFMRFWRTQNALCAMYGMPELAYGDVKAIWFGVVASIREIVPYRESAMLTSRMVDDANHCSL
jgi:hypothetical protein